MRPGALLRASTNLRGSAQSVGGNQREARVNQWGCVMLKLKHDDIEATVEATASAGPGRKRRVRWLGGWLWRALGRQCTAGLWTMTPDGKLNCESWRVEAGQ